MLYHLFPRCPVLPVDASVSLTQYTRTITSTLADAAALEREGTSDARERAALLHIRVLQLVCKTLPAHPEAALPEAAPLLAALARRAEPAFARLEAYAGLLAKAGKGGDGGGSRELPPPPAMGELGLREVVVAEALVGLFERGSERLAAVAGRVEEGVVVATAVVVVSQRVVDGEVELLYPGDVVSLLAAKGLLHVGWLRLEEEVGEEVRLGARGLRLQRSCEDALPEFVTGVVEKRAERDGELRVDWVRCARGGDEGVAGAHHVAVKDGDDAPAFKLYDLRPMATVHEAKAKAASEEATRKAEPDPVIEVTEPET